MIKDCTRARNEGKFIIETGATVRETAKEFGMSKSTIHKDVTDVLKKNDPKLYKKVRTVLDKNKAERNIRGGKATKEKYLRLKKK